MPDYDIQRAIDLYDRGMRLQMRGQNELAAQCFEEAATHTMTPAAAEVLREKAANARRTAAA